MDVCYHPVWVPMPSHFSKVVFTRDGRGPMPKVGHWYCYSAEWFIHGSFGADNLYIERGLRPLLESLSLHKRVLVSFLGVLFSFNHSVGVPASGCVNRCMDH